MAKIEVPTQYQPQRRIDPFSTHRSDSFRVELLTRDDELMGVLDGVAGGSIERNSNATLTGGGNILLDDFDPREVDFSRERFRVIYQLNEDIEMPLGTYIISNPRTRYSEHGKSWDVRLLDKMWNIQKAALGQEFSITTGSRVTDIARQLVEAAGEQLVSVTDSDAVWESMSTWEPTATRLEVVNDLLDGIGYWALFCDIDGVFQLQPYEDPASRPVARVFAKGKYSIHSPTWEHDLDLSTVPNHVVATSQTTGEDPPLVAEVFNYDPDSPTSIPRRGATISHTATGVDVADQAGLNAYAQRTLLDFTSRAAKLHVTYAPVPLREREAVEFESYDYLGRATVTRQRWQLRPGALVDAEWREVHKLS